MELIGLHIAGYTENVMVTIWHLLDNTELHSVGCASFVERMDAPTIPPPTRKPAVCGWGDNTCVVVCFYKANTHFVVYMETKQLTKYQRLKI